MCYIKRVFYIVFITDVYMTMCFYLWRIIELQLVYLPSSSSSTLRVPDPPDQQAAALPAGLRVRDSVIHHQVPQLTLFTAAACLWPPTSHASAAKPTERAQDLRGYSSHRPVWSNLGHGFRVRTRGRVGGRGGRGLICGGNPAHSVTIIWGIVVGGVAGRQVLG